MRSDLPSTTTHLAPCKLALLLTLCAILLAPTLFAQSADTDANADPAAADSAAQPATDRPAGKLKNDAPRVRAGGEFAVWNTLLGTTGRENRDAYNELGTIGEFAGYVSISKGDYHVQARACYSCHGLEVEQAFFEYRGDAAMRIRFGRFLLPMGSMNETAYPGSLHTVSKPLTRSMGLMLRASEFNQGVLPAPTSDNGAMVSGSVDLEGIGAKLAYSAFVVRGFKGAGFDLNFIGSRDYEDHNNEPAYGGRLEISGKGAGLGFSYTGGTHDAGNGNNRYDIAVVDFRFDLGFVKLEGEVIGRRTEFDVFGEDHEDHWNKAAAWMQMAIPVTDQFTLIVAGDGMHVGNAFLSAGGPTATQSAFTTDDSNQVWRASVGFNYTTEGGVLFKLIGEYWAFSDFKDSFVFQVGAVWKF